MHEGTNRTAARHRARMSRYGLIGMGALLAVSGTASARNVLGFQAATPTLRNAGIPTGLSVDAAGAASFVNEQGAGIVKSATAADGSSQFTEDVASLTLADRPLDTATDGQDLWVTLQGTKAIGRKRADGTLSYEARAMTAPARHIAVGQSGTIWFSEPSGDRIGRLITTGPTPALKEFALTPGTAPDDIVALADGSVIVSSRSSGTLVRLNVGLNDQPTTTVITLGATGLPAGALAGDAVSNTWVTQPDTGKVWKVGRGTNVATEVPGLSGVVRPQGIAIDARSNVWIADPGARGLIRITSAGRTLPVYRAAGVLAPTEIAIVPGGGGQPTMWVIDGNQVSHGSLSQSGSRFVIAPGSTVLRSAAGKAVRVPFISSDEGTVTLIVRRGAKVCARITANAISGPGVIAWNGRPGASCQTKGAAAKRPIGYRMELKGEDIDGNAALAPRVNLVVSPRAVKRV